MAEFLNANIGLLIGALVLLAALIALAELVRLRARTRNPEVKKVIGALMPWTYKAIFAGERASLWAMQDIGNLLQGTDKKAVADSLYQLFNILPNSIDVDGVTIPLSQIKKWVSREKFENLVEDAYRDANFFIQTNEEYLKKQVGALNPPPSPVQPAGQATAQVATGLVNAPSLPPGAALPNVQLGNGTIPQAAPTAPQIPASTVSEVKVTTTQATVTEDCYFRSSPDMGNAANVIGDGLKKSEVVTLLGGMAINDGHQWARIKTGKDVQGWVMIDLLKPNTLSPTGTLA